ncbi:MAG TPA: valine--tRNA ligase, partial [Thermoanaerobaculia bacterium]|nr:valine--tRNA ligase [Thermoanaerobaculia bacterium]
TLLAALAHVAEIGEASATDGSGGRVVRGVLLSVELDEQDSNRAELAEKARAELAQVDENLGRVRARLGNPGFTEKAPAAVVEGARRQLAELEDRRARLLESLGGEG